jgi:hypothetical protein
VVVATAEVVTGQPHPALRRYVQRYVGYRLDGYPPGVHRGLPSRLLTFIVRLDEPGTVVAGLRTSAALLPHRGELTAVDVSPLRPGGAGCLRAPGRRASERLLSLGACWPGPLVAVSR